MSISSAAQRLKRVVVMTLGVPVVVALLAVLIPAIIVAGVAVGVAQSFGLCQREGSPR